MTEFTTRDGRQIFYKNTQIFYKKWSADQLIVFSHGSPVLFPTSPDARGSFIRYKRGD